MIKKLLYDKRLSVLLIALLCALVIISSPKSVNVEQSEDQQGYTAQSITESTMFLETIEVGPLETNCYIVAAEETLDAMIIDPGAQAGLILDTVAAENLNVKFVVLTHAHWDHFSAAPEILEKTGAKLLIHALDKVGLYDSEDNLSSVFFGIDKSPDIKIDMFLEDEQTFNLGDLTVKVLHTPGHTPGGISLLVGDALFSGDLLFYRSIGRTDFAGGSLKDLETSVRTKVFTLPDHVRVYPGHGPATTVGAEKKANPYF